jgi:hypothetical protein
MKLASEIPLDGFNIRTLKFVLRALTHIGKAEWVDLPTDADNKMQLSLRPDIKSILQPGLTLKLN